MVKSQVHVFPTKRSAVNFRNKLVRKGHAVGKITRINERSRGVTYRYRLKASKAPVK